MEKVCENCDIKWYEDMEWDCDDCPCYKCIYRNGCEMQCMEE